MKKLVITLILTYSATVLAQQGQTIESRNTLPKQSSTLRGFFVGVDYMNLTDMTSSSTSTRSGVRTSESTQGGTHLGMGGIRMGYNQAPDIGFGFNAGLRLLQTMNASEAGGGKAQMLIPDVNLIYAVNRIFVPYVGVNTTFLTSENSTADYQNRIGGQLGLGVRFTRKMMMSIGSTLVSLGTKYQDTKDETEGEFQLNGFTTNLTYTF